MRNRAIALISVIVLASCTTHQPLNGTAIDEMNVALHTGLDQNKKVEKRRQTRLPSVVSKAMLPTMRMPSQRPQIQRRFSLNVKDVPAKSFYMGLVKNTPVSIVVSPEVKGTITLNLKNVNIPQVLQTLEDVYGYAYRRTAIGYEIQPNKLKTKIYAVNYLELERKGRSSMSVSSGQVSLNSNTTTSNSARSSTTSRSNNQSSAIGDVETKSTVDFWKQLQRTLSVMIGEDGGRSVTMNPLAGVVVVRAFPRELKQVEVYLDAVQNNMDRQVILEAKILEVTLNDQYQMGIDWRLFGARLNAIGDFPGTEIVATEFPNAFTMDIHWNPRTFTSTIQALETQGNVQVLSSPRVATMNNQKSVIKVGSDEFFVTNVSSSTTSTTTGTTPTQDVELTPFFSGITLDVTPQIDGKGNVTLHVHPSVSRVQDQRKQVDLGVSGVLDLPLANSTIRESDTIVHAKNGQVVVIGGLMQNRTQEDIAQLPFFGNIPFLGKAFRATKQTSRKSELVILIRPTVVKRKTWSNALGHTQQRMAGLKRGFHYGGRPDLFGSEGEVPIVAGPKSGIIGP